MVQPGKAAHVGCQPSLFGEDQPVYRKREEYVVETICRDLEREGYTVQPLLIPACAVGAPHRRDRIWFVAHADGKGLEGRTDLGTLREEGEKTASGQPSRFLCPGWEEFPTQSPVCGRDDGVPRQLDGITFSSWRQQSVKGYGNAIVPQVIYEIFKAIESTYK